MTLESLDSAEEIEKIATTVLVGSKAYGTFPTPIDKIINFTELSIANNVDLSQTQPSLLARGQHFFGKVSRKILGIIDIREKTIYLDHSQPAKRKNFVKLHEVGHGVIPWQRDLLGCQDDEETIVPEIKEKFEREASAFASAALFQMERFAEEAAKLPLGLRSARALSEKFGGSGHAAIRRYVEGSPKRCAVLVFHKTDKSGPFPAQVRNYFESPCFTAEFGGLTWPNECGLEFPFVFDIKIGRKDHQDGQVTATTRAFERISLNYHFYNNTYNVFVLLFPVGEQNASRVNIVLAA